MMQQRQIQMQQHLLMQQQQQRPGVFVANAYGVFSGQIPMYNAQQALLSHHQLPQTAYPGSQHQIPYQQNQQMWPPQAFPHAAQQPPAAPVAFQDLFSSGRGKGGGAAEEDDDFTDFATAPPPSSVPSKAAKSLPHGVDRNAPLDMGLFGAPEEPQHQVWQQLLLQLPNV